MPDYASDISVAHNLLRNRCGFFRGIFVVILYNLNLTAQHTALCVPFLRHQGGGIVKTYAIFRVIAGHGGCNRNPDRSISAGLCRIIRGGSRSSRTLRGGGGSLIAAAGPGGQHHGHC